MKIVALHTKYDAPFSEFRRPTRNDKSAYRVLVPGILTITPLLEDGKSSRVAVLVTDVFGFKSEVQALMDCAVSYFSFMVGLDEKDMADHAGLVNQKTRKRWQFYWDNVTNGIVRDMIWRTVQTDGVEFTPAKNYSRFIRRRSPYDDTPSTLVVGLANPCPVYEVDALPDILRLLECDTLSRSPLTKAMRERLMKELPREVKIRTTLRYRDIGGWWRLSETTIREWLRAVKISV